jgi:hypothetical protein
MNRLNQGNISEKWCDDPTMGASAMTENPEPTQIDAASQSDVIKIGFLRVPRDQVFPLVMAFIVLTAGAAIVVVTTDAFRLMGLVVIVVGLGWAALIYQNAQNARNLRATELGGSAREYDLTITALSTDNRPVRGALVTVLGPVSFTEKPTNRDGRVVYKYTGRDVNSYRNREVIPIAAHTGAEARRSILLTPQTGQFVEITLPPPLTVPVAPRQPAIEMQPAPPIPPPANELDPALFQRIEHIIVPYVSSQGNQSALINRAFFGSPVINQIQVGQAASVFATHVIRQLYNFNGKEAIATLLMTLRSDVGPNKQREIDTLIEQLRR